MPATDSFATRGPRGYDEVNQARKAGYFRLAACSSAITILIVSMTMRRVKPDRVRSRRTRSMTPATIPVLRDLPPAQPAFIWYPYGPSPDFPRWDRRTKRNGRTGILYGHVPDKKRGYPDYYNGKLIIYDWMRGWIKAVTMQPNGDFDKMEPFCAGVKMNSRSIWKWVPTESSTCWNTAAAGLPKIPTRAWRGSITSPVTCHL